MRLDKFLKVSRVIKRRAIAKKACDDGNVFVNDNKAKASSNVKMNDIIKIQFGEKEVKVKVLDIKEHSKKEDVSKLIEYI